MNLLERETSPYLRQHKDNPVHWMPWGSFALAKAKAENKPILLSIGYAACHWCHVMAHESFEDEATAALMNQHFINIKVDREERPDLDMIYQRALALMDQQGGWPLTMFLTPAGEPFWGGTYFPPLARHGLPSFREVLRGVHMSWTDEQERINHNVHSLTTALHKLQAPQTGGIVTREMLDKVGFYFLSAVDSAHGGFGGAPKFPSLPALSLVWDNYIRSGNDAFKAAVVQSLTSMCQGGIYDHLGGGFARYTVDAEWLVPHFEKMLYDNALFVSLLAEVYKETQNPLFRDRIRETIAFMARDMAVTAGDETAFASSFDADSDDGHGHKHEGAYYVWRADDVDAALGADALLFKQSYDVTAFGNWEGVNILNRLKHQNYMTDAEEKRLVGLREKLLQKRAGRTAPQRDDKVLADWNGLAIAALIRASFALAEPEYMRMAGNAFSFVTRHMMDADGKLNHVYCEDRKAHAAMLDDYANMMDAALLFFENTRNHAYLAQAEKWAAILQADYYDNDGKGFFLSLESPDLILRPKTADDTATPSGNGALVGTFGRLYFLTGRQSYLALAEETARAFSADIMQRFFPLTTLLANSDFVAHPVSVVLAGRMGREALMEVLRTISLPRMVLLEAEGAIAVPDTHPAYGKQSVGGRATAYICVGRTCLPPVTDAEELRQLLLEERRRQRRPAANDS
ncbi:MAG: thioredoxin domain-containing protein [Micavibrio sp.]|nr:thioredoxin domain-containing protein [Micavibrio sp.]